MSSKRLISMFCGVVAVGAISMVSAGSPDDMNSPLRGFFVGVQGMAGVVIAQNNYKVAFTEGGGDVVSADFNELGLGALGGYGGSIGFDIPLSSHNALEPMLSYDKLEAAVTTSSIFYESGDGNTVRFSTKIALKHQFNLGFSLRHLTNSNFIVAANFGVSLARLRAEGRITHIAPSTQQGAGQGASSNKSVYGPFVGLGLQWLCSVHSLLSFNFNNYFYVKNKLNVINNPLSTQTPSEWKKRDLRLDIPTVTMGYSYYF